MSLGLDKTLLSGRVQLNDIMMASLDEMVSNVQVNVFVPYAFNGAAKGEQNIPS
jgi:hypothetical protein